LTEARRPTQPALATGQRVPLNIPDIAWSAGSIVLAAAVANLVAHRYGEVAAALVFVLGITVAGAIGGLIAALLAAVAAFLIFNFTISEPVLTLRIANGRDVAPLIFFSLCALVTGVLAGRLRDRTEAARASNLQLANLLTLSRALQSAARLPDVVAVLQDTADPMVGARVTLFQQVGQTLEAAGPSGENEQIHELATSVMTGADAVVTTEALLGVRLEGASGPIGAIVLRGPRVRKLDVGFVDAVARLIALAVERARLSEQIAERRANARAEELKTALLASVSHDFRTPLTAISASASSLLAYGDKLERDTSDRFLGRIVEDCERLNRYTANLLEMSRLEAGESASLQLLSVAEMLGVAVQRVRARAGGRTIRTLSPSRDLLVRANPALFELVLINVLENAITYSEDHKLILVTCERGDDEASISVADQGCGVPDEALSRIFDRFYRVSRAESSPRGSGLGLAIAKGFVEALGGRIEARTPGIGLEGTEIVIHLPLVHETASA